MFSQHECSFEMEVFGGLFISSLCFFFAYKLFRSRMNSDVAIDVSHYRVRAIGAAPWILVAAGVAIALRVLS